MSNDKKTIEVDFEIGQKVKIKVNTIVGKIIGIWADVSRISYNVEWVSSTTAIMDKWFVSKEIEAINNE